MAPPDPDVGVDEFPMMTLLGVGTARAFPFARIDVDAGTALGVIARAGSDGAALVEGEAPGRPTAIDCTVGTEEA